MATNFVKVSEIDLFKKNIKPALLISKVAYDRDSELHDYEKIEFIGRGYVLYNTPSIKPKNNTELGIVLGYYPKACISLYKDHADCGIFINFSGLIFNVSGYLYGSIKWCLEQYGDKILEQYGSIKLSIMYTRDYRLDITILKSKFDYLKEFRFKEGDIAAIVKESVV